MPKVISDTENLFESDMATAFESCPLCGAQRGDGSETDRHVYSDAEIIRELAIFMLDDWKACCVMLLYVACPNAPVRDIVKVLSPHTEDAPDVFDHLAAWLRSNAPGNIKQSTLSAASKAGFKAGIVSPPRLGNASICNARQRAAERFPSLSGLLGLKSPVSRAQQARFRVRPETQGEIFP